MNEKKPDWLVPGYPALKGEDVVGEAAVEGQIKHYPKVVRSSSDPPIPGQAVGCVSLALLEEPKKLKNGKSIYGFFKLRGNWPDVTQAQYQATKIVKEVDSKFQIRVGHVGQWLPITEYVDPSEELTEVHDDNDEKAKFSREAIQQKSKETERMKREMEERAQEVRKKDIYDDPLSLDFYTMKRVTESRLEEMLEFRRKGIQSLEDKLTYVRKMLKVLEKTNPDYREKWIDHYNEKRRESGIGDYIPSEKEIESYEKSMEEIEVEKSIENMDAKEAVEVLGQKASDIKTEIN